METTAFAFRWRGWIGGLLLLPTTALILLSRPRIHEGTLLEGSLDLLAWLFLAAGGLLRIWATMYIGGHKSVRVIADGPYALVRHPLYLGSFLILLAYCALFKSVLIAAVGIAIAVAYAVIVIPSEERHLRNVLGPAYAAYCERVPRFLLRWRLVTRPGIAPVKVASVLHESLRILACAIIAAGIEFLLQLREAQAWTCPLGIW